MQTGQQPGAAPGPGLPTKPVLEMALNLDKFKQEVQLSLQAGLWQDIEYVLLKIAMEVQDKANMLTIMQQQQNFRVKGSQEL